MVFVAAGLLAIYGGLPWWSMLGIALGLLVLALGTLNWVAKSIAARITPRSEAYHSLTTVIEAGRELRTRVSELQAEPPESEAKQWDTRIEDWTAKAERTVERVAPFRVGIFKVDYLISDYPGYGMGRPRRIAVWEYDLESRLERLLYIRATL